MRPSKLGLLPILALAAGCWHGQPSSLALGEADFEPAAGQLEGWRVKTYPMTDVLCPDGTENEFYAVYPVDASGAQPVAVVLHSGAFDWVIDPDPTDPLHGDHFADPSRLTSEFAAGKAFATLGMYPDPDSNEASTGAIALALAERGVTMIVPGNCWGDMWHNQEGVADNDTTLDGFVRRGGDAALWAWSFVAEPGFPTANRVTPPVEFDRTQVLLVGLGEGGRGVSELLAGGAAPSAAMLDSAADDLTPYYGDSELYGDIVVGLDRMFPGGQSTVDAGALHDSATPLPPRIAYVYSSLDGSLPASTHDPAIARLEAETTAAVWVQDTLLSAHVSTASDSATAGLAADFLLDSGN